MMRDQLRNIVDTNGWLLSADGRDHSYSIMHDQEGNFVATILSAILWTRIKIGLRPWIKLSAFFSLRSVQLHYNFIKRPEKEYGPTTGLLCWWKVSVQFIMDYEGPVDEYGYNHSFVLYKECGNYVLHFSAVRVQRSSIRVQRSSVGCSVAQRAQRSSVGSALAFCKAGPSSNLSMAPLGGFSLWADKLWRKWREASTNGDGWIYILYECDYECMENEKKIK
jgi:hypothetical protein